MQNEPSIAPAVIKIISVTLSVCVFVRAVKGKRLQLSTPKSAPFIVHCLSEMKLN